MADDEAFVLLRDGDGEVYALPADVLERAKLPAGVALALDAEAEGEGEVAGFAMPFFSGRLLTVGDFGTEQSYTHPTTRLRRRFDLNQHLDAVRATPGGTFPPP